jgi:hypothetical protein
MLAMRGTGSYSSLTTPTISNLIRPITQVSDSRKAQVLSQGTNHLIAVYSINLRRPIMVLFLIYQIFQT